MSCPGDGIGYFSEPCKDCKNCVPEMFQDDIDADSDDDPDDEISYCDCAKWDGQGTDEPHERGAHPGCVYA